MAIHIKVENLISAFDFLENYVLMSLLMNASNNYSSYNN